MNAPLPKSPTLKGGKTISNLHKKKNQKKKTKTKQNKKTQQQSTNQQYQETQKITKQNRTYST